MILYAKSKAQHLVEGIFLLTAYPICSWIEFDKIDCWVALAWLGTLLALTVFNTIMANILKGGAR